MRSDKELNIEALKLIHSDNFNLKETVERYSKKDWETYYKIGKSIVDERLEHSLENNLQTGIIGIYMYMLYKQLPDNILELHKKYAER